MADFKNPRVGVGVFILQRNGDADPTFIMGQRQGSTGAGTWALPGGHLELGESFEECAQREVMEETGLQIKNLRFLTATNDIMNTEGKHYITIFMVCERHSSNEQPQLLEPNKCLGWEWVPWSQMKGWAVEEGQSTNSINPSNESVSHGSPHRLFTPMIALLQQRPDVIPK